MMDAHHHCNNDEAEQDGGNISDKAATTTTAIMMVIGMNRPRLTKIMDLVHNNNDDDFSNHGPPSSSSRPLVDVEYVPCLAQMSSYESEDECGQTRAVRYLAQLVHLDGSSLTKFLDDDQFRTSLQKVVLVGYEWQQQSQDDDDDDDTGVNQLQRYFEANQLRVTVVCVQPNVEFGTLQDEMKFFKNLGDDDKTRHLANRTMGPGKMAQFIVDMARSIIFGDDDDQTRNNEVTNEKPKDFGELTDTFEDDNDNGNGTDTTAEIPQEPLQASSIDRIDPDLPSFACRICRTKLFGENHLASDHVPNLHTFKRSQHGATSHHATASTAACQSVFCDESVLEWLGEHGNSVEGRLTCPKCSAKLGHWNWSGAQCSCATWVVPAIQIPLSKVDVIHPEVTTTTTFLHVLQSPLQTEVAGAGLAEEAIGVAI